MPEKSNRGQVADIIDVRRREICGRWVAEVQRDTGDRPIEPTQLRDAMPEYLRRMAEVLRSEHPLGPQAQQMWVDVARHHAVTRVQQGFNIEELIHEFVILRRVLTDILDEEGATPSLRDAVLIVEIIEAAISASVKAYVESRDAQLRREQATHIGFLVHELRNPLAAAKMAADQLDSVKDGDARGMWTQRIHHSLARLQELVSKVLTLERLEGARVEAKRTEFRLSELLDDVLPSAQVVAASKGIDLRVDANRGATVRADRTLTASALQNLVDNAVKYTDAGRVEVRVEDAADAVAFHVFDQCGGLPPEELARVFEPFRRGHPDKPGTGLGLAIARNAVEAQGGSIAADSTAVGCHFHFRLPKP